MQFFTTLLLVSLTWSFLQAQTGSYSYQGKGKSSETKIDLDLRRDGVFIYNYQKGWVSCETRGKWRPLGSGRVILTSDHQLTDYQLEAYNDKKIEGLRLIIQSMGKNTSPSSIDEIYINEDETASFQPDGEAALELLAQRQRQLMAASDEVRDSINNTDPPRFYTYKHSKKVSSITLIFNNQELVIPIQEEDAEANTFVLTTNFATNAAYKYMKETEFVKKGDFIKEMGRAIKLKKNKP
jgi:hypothetical protein